MSTQAQQDTPLNRFDVAILKYRAHLEMGYTIVVEHLKEEGYNEEISADACRDELASFLEGLVREANKELESAG